MAAAGPEVVSSGISKSDDDVFETYLLCEHLPLYPKANPLYQVTLATRYLSMELTELAKRSSVKARPIKARKQSLKGRRSSSLQSVSDDSMSSETRQAVIGKGGLFLSMDDIIGCDCMKGKTEDDKQAYLTVYAYPHKKKLASKRTIRKRETLTLIFNNCDSYDANMKEARMWMNALQCLAKRVDISNIHDLSKLHITNPKKMLVLINPFGGQGKAVQMFKQRVVPILSEASISFDMRITEYAGHAREMMMTLDTRAWYGIVMVSGDGLIHEVVNGLMHRSDWEEAMKTPLGFLPCGSGNALCCSLSHEAGEPFLEKHVIHCAYAIAKHKVAPMDLVAIDTCRGERLYSFLMCAFGIMADADIESEKYRALGNARFTIGAIVRILALRKYRGKISFLPAEDYDPPTPIKESIARATSVMENATNHPSGPTRSQSMVAQSTFSANPGGDRSIPGENGLNGDVENTQAAMDDLEKVDLDEERAEEVKINAGDQNGAGDASRPSIETPLLAPLDQPVPADWLTVEGEFVNVAAIYQSHLAKDLIAVPSCRPNEGFIYLNITLSSITRMRLISVFNNMQEGKHTSTPESQIIKVKAFRFEPQGTDGIMTCDGESFPYGPIQGQILPAIANIMVLKKHNCKDS